PRFAKFSAICAALALCDRPRSAAASPDDKPGGSQGGPNMKLTLTSTAFEADKPIPKKHTEDGEDRSPPLHWSGAPDGVKEFALIVDDPDAPQKSPWVHWVIYKIPATTTNLPES